MGGKDLLAGDDFCRNNKNVEAFSSHQGDALEQLYEEPM